MEARGPSYEPFSDWDAVWFPGERPGERSRPTPTPATASSEEAELAEFAEAPRGEPEA